MKTYQVKIKTNSYAGNFERELCAFMTGLIGECTVGAELVDEKITPLFENRIMQMSDDHGTYRPVALDEKDANNIVLCFQSIPTQDECDLLIERAKLFEKTRPYEYLDKNFKFLKLEVLQIDNNVVVVYEMN